MIGALIAVWAALALISYRDVIGILIHQWQNHPSYSHGPIVIPIAVWLLWHRRATRPTVTQPWPAACGLLILAHVLLWIGDHFYLPALQLWSIPLWLSGMVGMTWGRSMLRWTLPGIGFVAFMIPLPFQLESMASQALQSGSAWCSCLILALGSTTAVTDGYTLKTESGRVAITADCSGLRMTVAIAALGYVISLLSLQRSIDVKDDGSDVPPRRLFAQFIGLLFLVIPAAIIANAARIAVMALVVGRFQQESYRDFAHELGDWLVLPVAAGMFLLLASWARYTVRTCRTTISRCRRKERETREYNKPPVSLKTYGRIAVVPILLLLIACTMVANYYSRRASLTQRLMTQGLSAESVEDWDRAAACYQELVYLDSPATEARYRYALVSLRSASSRQDRQHVQSQLEAVLSQSPLHAGALRAHLDLSLELDDPAALRSAQRLYSLKSHDSATTQMCFAAMLRYHPNPATLPSISIDNVHQIIARLGPVADWREDFLFEFASLACRYPVQLDGALIRDVTAVIADSAAKINSAEAYYVQWNFDRLFGDENVPLCLAQDRIDETTPATIAYKIHLASAGQALRNRNHGLAKECLRKAFEVRSRDPRGHELLGDIHASSGNWKASEQAYLQAWNLAGNQPVDIGIKLADAMTHCDRRSTASKLVDLLNLKIAGAKLTIHPMSRVRLKIVQARLELHSANVERALQHVEYALSTFRNLDVSPPIQLRSTVESLQAQCLVRLNRYADAARLFESRANRMEDPADQWRAAARAWRTAGNAAAAQRCYRNAVLQATDQPDLWLEYVHLLLGARGADEAKREIIALKNRQPTDSPATDHILAQAWELVGESDRAIEHYRRSVERDPEQLAAYAIALARRGMVAEALIQIASERWKASLPVRAHTAAMIGVSAPELTGRHRANITRWVSFGVEHADQDVRLLLAAAEWFSKCDSIPRALQVLERAVELQPDNVIAANNLAMLLADSKRDFAQALAYIDGVLEQSGPAAEFLDTKGWILVLMDRADEALPILNSAVDRLDVDDPISRLHLAAAYLAVGDREQARQHWQRAGAERLRPDMMNSGEQRALAQLQAVFRIAAVPEREG